MAPKKKGKPEPEPEKKLSRGDVDELIDDGTALVEERDWAPALAKLESAAEGLEGFEEHMVMSRLCAKIGQCQLELRDINGALRTFDKQLSSASEEKDKGIRKEGQASAHANLAHAHAMLGKDNEALEALEKSDGLLKDAPTQQARNASLAGVIHFRKGDMQKALVCHQKDLELSNALVKNEDAHPLITLRAKHNCALCLCRQGKFRPARQEFDGCAKLLDESTVVPEDADGLFRGASPATVQARALYHAALATQAPSLDVGARSRLERAASLIPPPDEPMRAEDALLGAFVQLALSQRQLDDSELELVERSIDAARRYAVAAQAKEPTATASILNHALSTAQAKAKAIGGDAAGASDAYQAALDSLRELEKPLPDQYGVSVLGDRSRADFLRTERRSSRVGLGACRRKGLGMGLYGSTGATTDQELQSALEVCELAISKDNEPQADPEALASLGHVGAVLGLQGKKADRDVEFEERLNRSMEDERQRMYSLRLLGDAADHDGDAVLALKKAREACALDSGNADAAKRLVAAYVAVGNKLANDAETQTKEVLSFTQIWNLEPHMRAMLEEDRHWVAANARFLAKVALEGYRGALEAA